MTEVFGVILSFYCLLLAVFLIGWILTRRQSMPAKGKSTPGISIVVALRNEEENIRTLVNDLSAIAYAPEKFEVIIVNDHSTDLTREKILSLIQPQPAFRFFDLPEGKEGKKEALHHGIKEARFEIIATTDADCQFSKNWITCISLYFGLEEIKMLVGPVKLTFDNSFFSQLQGTEFTALVGSTAALIGLGHPIMCNGANLAFRKDTFKEVGGYEDNFHVASGDDEFLMRKIFKRYPSGIRFSNYYEAVVSARTQKTLREFFNQRIRWAGKWKHNSDSLPKLLAVFILASQIAFIGLIIKNFIRMDYESLGLIVNKVFLEAIFLFWVGRFLQRKFDIVSFLTLQIIYPIYVIAVGVISLVSPYRWKGRNYK